MEPKTVSFTRTETQVIIDSVENVGILDSPVIKKFSRALDDGEEEFITLSLWPREIQEIIQLTQRGKLYHQQGDTFLQSAVAKMQEALTCGSTQDDSANQPGN